MLTKEERAKAHKAFWDHWNDCDDCGMAPGLGDAKDKPLCAKGKPLWDTMEQDRYELRMAALGLSTT